MMKNCLRCGKPVGDNGHIHTCTPQAPADPLQALVEETERLGLYPRSANDQAREIYLKILAVQQSYKGIPSEDEQLAEHHRVFHERVRIIDSSLNAAFEDGQIFANDSR